MAAKRILLVDDEANPDPTIFVRGNYLTYYEVALVEAGFQVDVVQNDKEAMDRIKSLGQSYDLILLDLHFPTGTKPASPNPSKPDDYGGVLVAKWLHQFHRQTKVIVLTNVTDEKVTEELEKLDPIKCVLFKHLCTPFKLVSIIRRILGI